MVGIEETLNCLQTTAIKKIYKKKKKKEREREDFNLELLTKKPKW